MTMLGLSSAAPSVLRTFPPFTNFLFNHESARMNTNKMPIKAKREGSGAPECQRREIKIPPKRACRGFYFSRPIRAANTSLSAIRAHLGNLTRYAHPFRAAFGTLSRFARLWLVSPSRTDPDAWLWLRFPPTAQRPFVAQKLIH